MSLLRRKPRGPVKRDPQNPGPDERIFGRHYRGPRPVAIGLIVALLFVVGFYLGFTKRIPFTSRGYELHATFENATTLKPNSLVRIAGVNVGKVSSVEPEGNMAEVTFNVSDDALPIHEDATIKVRPRLFLEGNFFLDVHPGSPSAPELDERVDDPRHADDHRRPDRRDPDLAPVRHQDQPAAGPGGVRGGAQRRADRRRGRHPGPGRAGPDRRPGDQQDLPLRRQGGPHQRDRQPGVPGRASARPLEPDPRPARPVREARLHRRGAERLHHQLQHHRRGVRLGVRQPLGLDPRARPHPPGGGALAAPPERRAAVGPQAGARVAARHPRAPGDDPRRLAVARAGGQAAAARTSWAAPPSCSPRRRRRPRPGRPRVAEAVPADRPLRPLRLPEPGPGRQRRDRRRRGRLPVQHRPAELSGSSSTASPSWRARARASTATAPSSASRPAAARARADGQPGKARRIPERLPLRRTTSRRRSRPARGFPAGRQAAVPDGRSLPHAGRPRRSTAPPAPSAPRARRRCREARDPRAPARLRGDRGPRRLGAGHHRGHPRVANDPAPVLDPPASGTTSSSSRPSSARRRR